MQLLEQGYRVRGTVRSASRQDDVRRALAGVAGVEDRLEMCVADLTSDDGWREAMNGATFVLHTASPLPARAPRPTDDLIGPARDGTLRVLRAASAAGVARVVVTSSIAAIVSGVPREPGRVFTEEDWSNLDGVMRRYSRGKTLAERAAWDYVASLPADRRMELATVNPSFVLGPSLGGSDNASNELVRKLLDREVPGLPRLMLPVVDVRDVAQAHLLAMISPHAAGERFIVSEGDYWYVELARVLKAAGYEVPTRVVPNWLVRLVGWFDPSVRLVTEDLGRELHVSADKAKRVLGWQARDLHEMVRDTARAITERRRAGLDAAVPPVVSR